VLSYAGQLNISVIADRDSCPDLPVFITGLNRSLSDLTGAAMAATPPTGDGPAA
jgi:WS/DGAT C-terminal domain